jgi:type IV pilus assembly protein PilN
MIRINLLPEVKRKAPKRKTKIARQVPYTWIIASLVAVLLAGVASMLIHLKMVERVEDRQKQAEAIQVEIDKFKIQQSLVEKARQQRNALAQKLEIIATLKRRQTGPVRLLDEMASAIPPKLWLEDMAEAGSGLTLTGYAVDHIQIANFMDNLRKSPIFSNIELVSSVAAKAAGGSSGGSGPIPVKNFEVTAKISHVVSAK